MTKGLRWGALVGAVLGLGVAVGGCDFDAGLRTFCGRRPEVCACDGGSCCVKPGQACALGDSCCGGGSCPISGGEETAVCPAAPEQ